MAYRMKMFKSQKPSSFDLRVSDFKRIPGFNYVLSVSTEDDHTYNSLCSEIREGKREKQLAIDAEPRARQRAKRKFQRRAVRCGLSGHNTVDPGRLSHSSP